MPEETHLTLQERKTVLNLHYNEGRKSADIAKEIERSSLGMSPKSEQDNNWFRFGRLALLNTAERRIALRNACKGKSNAPANLWWFWSSLSVSRVRQILIADPHLRWTRMCRAPARTLLNLHRRIGWANNHISWNQVQWGRVIWSDKMWFTMDGPDGHCYYWHDKSCQKRIFL